MQILQWDIYNMYITVHSTYYYETFIMKLQGGNSSEKDKLRLHKNKPIFPTKFHIATGVYVKVFILFQHLYHVSLLENTRFQGTSNVICGRQLAHLVCDLSTQFVQL